MSDPLGKVAQVELVRACEVVSGQLADLLRASSLSESQFDVLSILRAAKGGSLPCGTIGERMVARGPDITRLLDKLVERGLVERTRNPDDRRQVLAGITGDGLVVLEALDEPIAKWQAETFGRLTRSELQVLIDLLRRVKARVAVENVERRA